MSNRFMYTDVSSNQPATCLVTCCLTFADDIGVAAAAAASVCAVTLSNGYVASVARTAEGIFPITFDDRWKRCMGIFSVEGLAGDLRVLMTAQSLNDSTPTVDLTFETGSTGADIDPDGEVLYVTFIMKNSSVAEGA